MTGMRQIQLGHKGHNEDRFHDECNTRSGREPHPDGVFVGVAARPMSGPFLFRVLHPGQSAQSRVQARVKRDTGRTCGWRPAPGHESVLPLGAGNFGDSVLARFVEERREHALKLRNLPGQSLH